MTYQFQVRKWKSEHLIDRLIDGQRNFREVLKREPPDKPANIDNKSMWTEFNISVSKLEKDEIMKAIGRQQNGKAAGVDRICAEFLKAVIKTTTLILYSRIWDEDVTPPIWQEGLIIKLAKRGELKNCNNWNGISLLSVPGNVFL